MGSEERRRGENKMCGAQKNIMMQLGEIIARLGTWEVGDVFLATRLPIDNGSWRGGMTQSRMEEGAGDLSGGSEG